MNFTVSLLRTYQTKSGKYCDWKYYWQTIVSENGVDIYWRYLCCCCCFNWQPLQRICQSPEITCSHDFSIFTKLLFWRRRCISSGFTPVTLTDLLVLVLFPFGPKYSARPPTASFTETSCHFPALTTVYYYYYYSYYYYYLFIITCTW